MKPEVALTRAEKAELTQKSLLDAAVKVIGAVGYAEASIARITQEANVAQGTFYNYFASQQEIFDALLPIVGQQLIDRIRAATAQQSDPLARERLRFENFFEFITETPEFYRLLTEAEVFAPVAHRRHTDNMIAGYVRSFKRLKAAGELADFEEHEFEAIAYMLIGMRHYLAMRYSYRPDSVQMLPDWVADVYTRILARGLFASIGPRRRTPPRREPGVPALASAKRLEVAEGRATAEGHLHATDMVAVQTVLSNLALTAAQGALGEQAQSQVAHVTTTMVAAPAEGRLVAVALSEIAVRELTIIRVGIHQGESTGPLVALVQVGLRSA